MTWEEAEVYCEQNGGHLVCIGSEAENNFLSEWLNEENMDYVSIGYTDRETEDEWVWLNEEEPTYENWNAGEPNNGLDIYENQNYAYMYKNGTWDDGRSYAKKPFLCEWETEEEEE